MVSGWGEVYSTMMKISDFFAIFEILGQTMAESLQCHISDNDTKSLSKTLRKGTFIFIRLSVGDFWHQPNSILRHESLTNIWWCCATGGQGGCLGLVSAARYSRSWTHPFPFSLFVILILVIIYMQFKIQYQFFFGDSPLTINISNQIRSIP